MTDEKIEHEQTEALFDTPPPPPPIRKGGSDYLEHLARLRYHDDLRPSGWTFWALAPVERRWGPRTNTGPTETVWLTDRRALYQALVEIDTGRILRRRVYTPRKVPA